MKNLFVTALFTASLMASASAAFAADGRTDPTPHTGTGSTSSHTFYPSCSGGHKGQFCGGRGTSSTTTTTTSSHKFYPSCVGRHGQPGCTGK